MIEQITTKSAKPTKGASASAAPSGTTQKGGKAAPADSKKQASVDQKSTKPSTGGAAPAKKSVGFQGTEKQAPGATNQGGRSAGSGGPRVNNRENNANQDQQRSGNDQRGQGKCSASFFVALVSWMCFGLHCNVHR